MKSLLIACAGLLLGVLWSSCGAADETERSVISEWNTAVVAVAEGEDGFLTLKGVRTLAMLHIALHDALNSVQPRYETYAYKSTDVGADERAALAYAAFGVIDSQYPNERQKFRRLRDKIIGTTTDPELFERGKAVGKAAAAAILKSRRGDGWNTEAEYRWHPMGPGVYAEFQAHSDTPDGFIFGAGWGLAQGFALGDLEAFRVPPPPSIESAEYARAFNEVKALGRFQTQARSPEQTHIALWWKVFVEKSHNRLARSLAVREDLSLHETARFFAWLNMAIFDAYVGSFENKFHYNHWRPYTAIRWAEHDGNSATQADTTWNNTHRHTYAFPSYPSAHGTACAAAMATFSAVFGDSIPFRMETTAVEIAGPFSERIVLDPTYRNFRSFAAAAEECGMSRVYLGIHFRYDSEAGVQLGERIGKKVVQTTLGSP